MSPIRMPTKDELLRLQKLFRTDKRIAETLGSGVTEHLVAYWRRKKGIPRYNFPKFSEKEIREVWDRFGDDFHAGLELGISKAAFYNWRRKYKITKKPDALKLEQLSLELFTTQKRKSSHLGNGRQTIIQKVIANLTGNDKIFVNDKIKIEPDSLIIEKDGAEIINGFDASSNRFVWNAGKIHVSFEGEKTAKPKSGDKKIIRDFCRVQNIAGLIEATDGDVCQILLDEGTVLPGQLTVGNCRNLFSVGSIGAIPYSIEKNQIIELLSDSSTEITVPETIRVNIDGRKPNAISARDVIQYILPRITKNMTSPVMVEFYGSGIEHLSISERITICIIAAFGNVAGVICPFDGSARRFINNKTSKIFKPLLADRNAVYDSEFTYDVNSMKPTVATQDGSKKTIAIEEYDGIPIRSVFIGGPANGKFDDLKIASEILKGKTVNSDVSLFIQPATKAIYLEAVKKGLIRAFMECGATLIPPGYFAAKYALDMMLMEGEKILSTGLPEQSTSGKSQIYYVSPATAAISALAGRITNPTGIVKS